MVSAAVGASVRRATRAIAARAQATVESIQGARTIDAYEIHDRQLGEIERASARARDIAVSVFTLFTRLVGRVNRAEFIGLTATLVVGFLLVRSGTVTVGQTTAAALMFHRLFNPIGMLMYNFDEIQAAGACLARLVGVVDLRASWDTDQRAHRCARGLRGPGRTSHIRVWHRSGRGARCVVDDPRRHPLRTRRCHRCG